MKHIMSEHNEGQYVTHRELQAALDRLSDKFSVALASTATEIKAEVKTAKPSSQSYVAWAGVVLGLVYFLWGKESASIEKKFDLLDKKVDSVATTPNRAMAEYESRMQRIENFQDFHTKSKGASYDRLLDDMLRDYGTSTQKRLPEK